MVVLSFESFLVLFFFFFQQQQWIYKIQEVLFVLLERLSLCGVAYPRTCCTACADLRLSLPYLSLLSAEITGIGHLVQQRKSMFKGLLYSLLQYKFKIFEKLSKNYLKCFYNRLNVTIPRTNLFSRFKLRKESNKCKIHPYSITLDYTPASLDGTSYSGPAYLGSLHHH